MLPWRGIGHRHEIRYSRSIRLAGCAADAEQIRISMSVGKFFEGQSRRHIGAGALLVLVAIGALDYVTGWELSVSLLYALTILFVAWYGSRHLAIVFALLSAAIWWWANKDVQPYVTKWGYAWATTSRLAYFVFVAIGGATLRAQQESNRARIEALERARELEHEITRISEREQRRIGQDLHDGICQELAAIRCALSSVRDDLRARAQPEAEATDEVVGLLKNAIVETRNLARGIFPVQMEESGLPAVLGELVSNIRIRQNIEIGFSLHGDVRISDPEVAMNLYRIAQEALSNAVQHSKAEKINVTLGAENDCATLVVSDDGVGLPDPLPLSLGMGLKTMRYRAQLIGAQLDIKNTPGGGVCIICALPAKTS